MPISADWQKFIDEYAADDVYWYFPKGGTADTDDFRKKFRAFQQFEGKKWTPDLQHKIADDWRKKKLSRGGSALPRQIKRVFENLGLCWIVEHKPVRVTTSGHAYIAEQPGRSQVLDQQVWRYQLPNPLNARTTTGIELFPHAFFVEALLACEGYIAGEEFVLFVSRARKQADLKGTVDRIKGWRNLPQNARSEILQGLRNTNYSTIHGNHSYSMAFHHCDLLLRPGQGGLCVDGGDIDALKRRLAKQKGTSEIIEFENEPDCIAFYGDPEHEGTQIEALEYYIDRSDVGKAVKVFRRLPKAVRGEMTPEEFEGAQFLEKDLEDYLKQHLDQIEPGLKFLGRQYSTTVGPIDLFARAENGDLVVIELKKGRAADKVFGQICRYMGCIKSEHADINEAVRGIIVGHEVDLKLRYATKAVPDGLVRLATFNREEKQKGTHWIKVNLE